MWIVRIKTIDVSLKSINLDEKKSFNKFIVSLCHLCTTTVVRWSLLPFLWKMSNTSEFRATMYLYRSPSTGTLAVTNGQPSLCERDIKIRTKKNLLIPSNIFSNFCGWKTSCFHLNAPRPWATAALIWKLHFFLLFNQNIHFQISTNTH